MRAQDYCRVLRGGVLGPGPAALRWLRKSPNFPTRFWGNDSAWTGSERHMPTIGPDRLTTQEAATRAGVSEETIRGWCRRHQIGQFDRRFGRYLIVPAKLRALLLRRHGVLPA